MHIDEEVKRNQEDLLQFGSRSRRPTRQKPSFRRNTNKIRESISSNRDSDSSSSRFKPSRPSLSRNRFSSRITQRTQNVSPSSTALVNPTPSKKKSFSTQTNSNTPKIEFKKFDRFSRPNVRKSLLNKLFQNVQTISQRVLIMKPMMQRVRKSMILLFLVIMNLQHQIDCLQNLNPRTGSGQDCHRMSVRQAKKA